MKYLLAILLIGTSYLLYAYGDNPTNISNNSGISQVPKIAIDTSGNMHVVWTDFSSGSADFLYSRWDGANWSKPTDTGLFETWITHDPSISLVPAMAIDASGNIHMVWHEFLMDGTGNYEIFYSRWNGTDWSTPVNISNTAGRSTFPAISVDTSGKLHVIWADLSPGQSELLYNHWDGENWSKPVTISTNFGERESSVSAIAVDASGNPHVVWTDNNQGQFEIFYSRWNGTGWSKAVNISNNVGDSHIPTIAVNASGHPHVVWNDNTHGNYEIFYSRWDGISWSNPVNISNTAGISSLPAMALDASGKVYVVWMDSTPGDFDIFYSRWDGTSWSSPVNISNTDGRSRFPKIARNASGNLHVVWDDETSGNYDIFYRELP